MGIGYMDWPDAADPGSQVWWGEDANAEGHSGQDEDDHQHSYADTLQ